MDSGERREMPRMLQARPRKTVADFMRLPEGTLAELIDGERSRVLAVHSFHPLADDALKRPHQEPRDGRTQDEAVAHVERPAELRQQTARVLHARPALDG